VDEYTLDQLVDAVRALLGPVGVPDGRVRDWPDARTLRWYRTVGLLDPPQPRGRRVVWGRRHALQAAAVKRLQAEGWPLALIRRTLGGATDAALEARVGG
jgi:hypothetical protein